MVAEMNIPPLLRCPICLDLLKDPVTLSTGQTYDRFCIQKWLAAGNVSCPVTMQSLRDLSVVPNHTLRHLIHHWLRASTFEDSTCISISGIKRMVEGADGSTLEHKLQILETIRSLPLETAPLMEIDLLGLVLELLFRNVENLLLVEKALFCAVKLMPFSELGSLCKLLEQERNYAAFLLLFDEGNTAIKRSLCFIVEAIFSSTEELSEKLGKSAKLVRMIVDKIINQEALGEAGIRALSAISSTELYRENMTQNGAVQGLVVYLSDTEKRKGSAAAMAMSTIENLLSGGSTAKDAILDDPWGVKVLVKMVFRMSEHRGSESAVNSLLIVCLDSEIAREKAIADGVLTQLLLLLQSQCSARTKTKARMLLRLLRSVNLESKQCLTI